MTRALMLLALIAALLTGGCSHYEPLSLHGAGSMRIEVEVYKGPLTVPVDGQVGELVGVLSDSIHALDAWRIEARAMMQDGPDSLSCPSEKDLSAASPKPGDRRDCYALRSAYDSSGDMLGMACYIINTQTLQQTVKPAVYLPINTCLRNYAEWKDKAEDGDIIKYLDGKFKACQKKIPEYAPGELALLLHCQGEIIAIAFDNLSTVMRAAAFRAADGNIRTVPRKREVRGLVVGLAFIASEYGNQIQARITVLQKQFNPPTILDANGKPVPNQPTIRDAKTLPVSDYLRDAGKTDFIQLYQWLHATTDTGFGAFPQGGLSPQERIRMAQRLTADYYWQKINEVYASGQGDVSMAFIKDDLGNWDLKSFSNDPSELLKAYRKVTDAALSTTARLLRGAASGGASEVARAGTKLGNAARAADLADRLATGQSSDTATPGLDLASLQARVTARLAAQKLRFETRGKDLDAEIAAQQAKYDQAKQDRDAFGADSATVAAAAEKMRVAEVAKAAAEQRKRDLPKDAVAAAHDTLDDHLATVAAMQQAVAGPAPAR